MYTCTHVDAFTHLYTYVHTDTHTCIRIHAHVHKHTRTHTLTRTHTYRHIRIHVHDSVLTLGNEFRYVRGSTGVQGVCVGGDRGFRILGTVE